MSYKGQMDGWHGDEYFCKGDDCDGCKLCNPEFDDYALSADDYYIDLSNILEM